MQSFYDEWLRNSVDNDRAVHNSPVVARGEKLRWVETVQDARTAVVIGRANDFPTQGTVLLKSEIPPGRHTGRHVHGEEAVYVLAGSGFAIIDDRRYDFKAGTALHVPYMSEHQLINSGSEPVTYLSAMSTDLDLFVRLGRVEQLTEKGADNDVLAARHPDQQSQFAPDGRRIALHAEDMIDRNVHRGPHRGGHHHTGHRHGGIWTVMGGSERPGENGFRVKAAAITHIFAEVPHSSSHRHSHTEAMLYVLEGSGYSVVDGVRYDWAAGDAVHVPPKMTDHEHFNDSDGPTRTLRIEFGIRYFYESLWDGYAKVEHRPDAIARDADHHHGTHDA